MAVHGIAQHFWTRIPQPGTVPENRTWTAFSGTSSDRSSEAAAVPGHSRQPPRLVRTPTGRRLRTRGGSDVLAPTSAGACFQRPSMVFSARLLPMFELPSAPSGPKPARPERAAHRLGPHGNLRARSRGCGSINPAWCHSSQAGINLRPRRDSRPWGFVFRLTERAGEEASGPSTSSVGRHVCALLLSVSPAPLFLFPGYLALGKKKKKSSLQLGKVFPTVSQTNSEVAGSCHLC